MTAQEIYTKLTARLGSSILAFVEEETLNPTIVVEAGDLRKVVEFLKEDPSLQFDFLMNLAGHDPAPESQLVVIYHLYATELDHYITLKTFTGREAPRVASIAPVYATADWHEREAYDLYGIIFEGHPDLKRILMEDDWEGWPLRKDYIPAEFYRGMRIQKEK